MSVLETFQLAIKNILSSKMRTFLTMLGIIIGVCAVIVIVGLGNGMQGYIEDSFADMGTESLTVMIMGRGSSRSVSEEDMYAMVDEHSDMLKAISPTGNLMSSVKIGPKGQIVIPKEARDMFGLEPGDTLVLMADKKKGLALQTVDKLNPLMKTVFNSLPSEDGEVDDE